MQKSKAKRDSGAPIRRLPFVVLWIISMGVIGTLSRIFLASNPVSYLTLQQVNIILTLVGGAVIGMAQVQLVEQLLKRSMRGWLICTVLGSFISLFLSNILQARSGLDLNTVERALFFIVGLIPTLLQTVWLWKRVHRAWLWPTITLIGNLTVNLLYLSSPGLGESPFAWILMLIGGLIQGTLMYFLWQHPKDTQKAKIDFAADNDSDEARIERLQDHERSNPLWDMGDEQTLQNEA